MIYLDSSVLLAWVFGEPRRPDASLWRDGSLVASQLLAFEAWTRVHAYVFGREVEAGLAEALSCVTLIEMSATVLGLPERALPLPVRTLDHIHLVTARYVRQQVPDLRLATYDRRMAEGARALGIPLLDLTA